MTAPNPTEGRAAAEGRETKSFDPAVLATLTTGTVLVEPFSLTHEAAEWIMGHPVWTHQFPVLRQKISDAVIAQFPHMPLSLTGFAGWEACRDAVRQHYGKAVEVARGGGETAIDPLDPEGWPEGMRDRLSDAAPGTGA